MGRENVLSRSMIAGSRIPLLLFVYLAGQRGGKAEPLGKTVLIHMLNHGRSDLHFARSHPEGVRAATDPAVKKMSEADMIAATRNDVGKMQPFKGKLTDEQIKDSVDYFRTFVKEAGKSARPTFFEAGRVGKHVMVVGATFYGFNGRKVWSLTQARTRHPLGGHVAREVFSTIGVFT
jgi:hypothetical protein